MKRTTYINKYYCKNSFYELHIYGLKHNQKIIIDKEDFPIVSSVQWGLMAVGVKTNLKIIPYTVVDKKSVSLGRWLLNVTDSNKKVEHKDGNNLNFLRSNLFINTRDGLKCKTKSYLNKCIPVGIFPIKKNNGELRGFLVTFKNSNNKKTSKFFSISKYMNTQNALQEACLFRNSILMIA